MTNESVSPGRGDKRVVDALAARIDQLEKSNRRMRLIGVALAAGLSAALTLGLGRPTAPDDPRIAPPAERVVVANRFVVLDNEGRTRAELKMNKKNQPGLWLFDENGQIRVVTCETGFGSILTLNDAKARPRLSLAVEPERASIGFLGEKLEPPILLFTANLDSNSSIVFTDGKIPAARMLISLIAKVPTIYLAGIKGPIWIGKPDPPVRSQAPNQNPQPQQKPEREPGEDIGMLGASEIVGVAGIQPTKLDL